MARTKRKRTLRSYLSKKYKKSKHTGPALKRHIRKLKYKGDWFLNRDDHEMFQLDQLNCTASELGAPLKIRSAALKRAILRSIDTQNLPMLSTIQSIMRCHDDKLSTETYTKFLSKKCACLEPLPDVAQFGCLRAVQAPVSSPANFIFNLSTDCIVTLPIPELLHVLAHCVRNWRQRFHLSALLTRVAILLRGNLRAPPRLKWESTLSLSHEKNNERIARFLRRLLLQATEFGYVEVVSFILNKVVNETQTVIFLNWKAAWYKMSSVYIQRVDKEQAFIEQALLAQTATPAQISMHEEFARQRGAVNRVTMFKTWQSFFTTRLENGKTLRRNGPCTEDYERVTRRLEGDGNWIYTVSFEDLRHLAIIGSAYLFNEITKLAVDAATLPNRYNNEPIATVAVNPPSIYFNNPFMNNRLEFIKMLKRKGWDIFTDNVLKATVFVGIRALPGRLDGRLDLFAWIYNGCWSRASEDRSGLLQRECRQTAMHAACRFNHVFALKYALSTSFTSLRNVSKATFLELAKMTCHNSSFRLSPDVLEFLLKLPVYTGLRNHRTLHLLKNTLGNFGSTGNFNARGQALFTKMNTVLNNCIDSLPPPKLRTHFRTKEFAALMLKSDTRKRCIICFEDIDHSNVYVLECGHTYHAKCIEKCINDKCPCCKSSFVREYV
jgi:hypothetical protein